MYWTKANAGIERLNKTLGKALRTIDVFGQNWKKITQYLLFQYQSTPHCIINENQAKLLIVWEFQGKSPSFENTSSKASKNNKEKATTKISIVETCNMKMLYKLLIK